MCRVVACPLCQWYAWFLRGGRVYCLFYFAYMFAAVAPLFAHAFIFAYARSWSDLSGSVSAPTSCLAVWLFFLTWVLPCSHFNISAELFSATVFLRISPLIFTTNYSCDYFSPVFSPLFFVVVLLELTWFFATVISLQAVSAFVFFRHYISFLASDGVIAFSSLQLFSLPCLR